MKDSEKLAYLIRAMPKAELHIHLEGSVRPRALLELGRRHPGEAHNPAEILSILENPEELSAGFERFGKMFLSAQNLMRTPDDFSLAVYELGRDMADQHILYREVTVAPYTHTHVQNKGLGILDLLQGLEEGRRRAYQDFGVEMRWVFGFARGLCVKEDGSIDLGPAERTLAYAVEGKRYGVVGLTVGGYELACPPAHFSGVFRAARQEGLLSLPHAGETIGPYSQYVRAAVEALEADRIGHGVRAIDDRDLLAMLRERQIPLDVCLTSNQFIRLYDDLRQHPFPRLDEAGLVLTVNTDDPALFNTDLAREFALLGDLFGYKLQDLKRLARNSFAACGAEADLKVRLLADFDQWSG